MPKHKDFHGVSRVGFETNSSSSHSLVFEPKMKAMMLPSSAFGVVKGDGVLHIQGKQDFGWEWEIWSDPADKISYMIIDGFPRERLKSLLISRLNVKDVVFLIHDDAYIDHQSRGTTNELFEATDDDIWAFLTNHNNHIRGGNDNSEGPFDY